MRTCWICVLVTITALPLAAQDSSKLSFSGYAEAYYQYDANEPPSKERPSFLYNHKRHNEFNINLVMLKAAYTGKKVRVNIALMAGNYAEYNLAAETPLMQHVLEANLGYSFSDKWSMDAGILHSHIGNESAISKDCWNLSRSLLAENSPYFETGIKLNYSPTTKWTASLLVLNGWQNIRETNSSKAVGTQLQFKPNAKWLFNSSTFIGNEKPDSVKKQVRFFHNFYVTGVLSPKLNIALLADIGTERSATWYGAALLLQYAITEKFRIGGRAEQYRDKKGVIVATPLTDGFKVTGFSLNLDLLPVKNIAFRAEARYLRAHNNLFEKNGIPRQDDLSMLGSIAVSF